MNYSNQSVISFLKGPVLQTVQGIIVVVFAAIYFLLASVIAFVGFEPFGKWASAKAIIICLTWPLILFLYFIKNNQPYYNSSWSKAVWMTVCGLGPIATFLYGYHSL